MATEIRHPEEKNLPDHTNPRREHSVQEFWLKNSKAITYGLLIVVLIVAGFFIYKNYFLAPEEQKASDAMWKAEDYYRKDSARLALNGDGASQGFLKVISKYGSTKSGKLAKFYAASCYMKLNDFNNAIKYLKDFSADDKLVSVRATGLLGDAYAETGKKADAAEQYKKAGTLFPDDNFNSPEYLFRAGLMYQDLGKTKDAIDAFQIIKDKYSASERGMDIDKYLARLGSLN
ncbi:MAG: tetratricopeptide repeat protein [Chitinophagaceae bacterium]|nr:tetratricopeptide repeat protein [Chitinophagaceae bacterium]